MASWWAAALMGAPWLAQLSGAMAAILYAAGGLVCHQLPERSFHLLGAQLPVCARCLGLYLGGALGALLWMTRARRRTGPWRRDHALMFLATAAVPTAATLGTAALGLSDPSNAWRAALALPLGVAGGRIVAAAATNHLK